MSDNPISLTNQLASRLKTFASNMGLSQVQIARILKLDQSQLSRFLDNKAGLSAEMTLKVLRLTAVSKKELALKFGRPEQLSSKIMHLQQSDQGSWVPGDPSSGSDPNASSSIIDDDNDNTEAFLNQQISIHQAAIAAISDYLVKAKVNKGSTTEGTRRVNSNATSQKAGAHSDEYRR